MNPKSKSNHPPPGKVTLYCFECDHESPIPGDWQMQTTDTGEVYHCPECATTITVRPHPRSDTRDADSNTNRCFCVGD